MTTLENMSKAIFTINFNQYDNLKEPLIKTPGWDYICFTDDEMLKKMMSMWTFRYPKILFKPHLMARYCYIHSQQLMKEYDLTIMIGGQIGIQCNLDHFINDQCDLSKDINITTHPRRDCIYKEGKQVIKRGYAPAHKVNSMLDIYRNMGYPENHGLYENGIIVRKRSQEIEAIEITWWYEVINRCHRDQLSLKYVLWMMNLEHIVHEISYKDAYNYFSIHKHKKPHTNDV